MDIGPSKLCLLVEPQLQAWYIEAIEKMVSETDIDIPLVIVNRGSRTDEKKSDGLPLKYINTFIETLRSERAWTLVHIERHLAWKLGGPSLRWRNMRTTSVESVDCLSNSEIITCDPVPDGGPWVKLPDSVVSRVATEADIAIRSGFGLIRGKILTTPEYGVLSFHPADIRKYRGLSTSLAYVNGDQELGITLQRLNESIDSGEIIAFETVDISDAHSLDNVYGRMKEAQKPMLITGIQNLKDPKFSPTIPESLPEYRPVTDKYHWGFAGRVLLKNVIGRLKRQYQIRM